MRQQQITVSLSKEELELIEQYAATRGIKKATAVKELAIRGLELTVPKVDKVKQELLQLLNPTEIGEYNVLWINDLLDKSNYLELLNKLINWKQQISSTNTTYAILLTLIDKVKQHESVKNMNNYLNNRNK